MGHILLRTAVEDDRDLLYRIKSDALRDYAEATWGPWDDAAQRKRFAAGFDARRFRIVMAGEEPIGLLETSDEEDCVRLRNIALVEEWRNRGIGAELVRQLAREAGRRIRLRVLKTNPAKAFYERLGFRVVGDPDVHWWEMVLDAEPGSGAT